MTPTGNDLAATVAPTVPISQKNVDPYVATGPVVVITGASSGIGADLVRSFAARGFRVAGLARRLDRLNELSRELGPAVEGVECDVSNAESVARAFDEVRARFGPIDGVIANAGFGVGGKVVNLSTADYRRQFDTNVFGVLDCFYAVKGDLIARRGFFAVVGSANSYISLPSTSAYCMSKFAVRALTESLRYEVAKHGVAVTLICPGFVATEIRKVDRGGNYAESNRDPVPPWLQMPSRTAAEKIARAVIARRREFIFPFHAKLGVFLERHAPWFIRAVFSQVAKRDVITRAQ